MGSEASKSYTVHEKNRDNSVDMNVNQVALSCKIFQLEATQEARQERMIGGKRKGWNAGSRDSDDYKTTIDTLTRAINSKEESKQVPRNRAALPQ